MMNKEEKKAPQVRFKGFVDDWEQRKYGEVIDLLSGQDFSPSEYNDTCTGIPYMTGASCIVGNETIVNRWTTVPRCLAEKGDVLLVCKGSGYGTIAVLAQDKAHIARQFMALKNLSNLDKVFNFYILNSVIENIKKDARGLIAGIARDAVMKQEIAIPLLEEQFQIGTFFKQLDNLITLLQRKLDKLQKLKQGFLQQLFPQYGENVPRLRFANFQGGWEQRKLGDLLSEVKRPIRMKDEEEYQLVTVKRRNEGIVSRGFFKGKEILVKSYCELRSGDYLISKRQVVHGANGIVPKNLDGAIVSNEYLIAIGNKSITSEFLSAISKLPQMYKLFFLSSYGIDIEKLVFDVEDWKKRGVSIPSVDEQNRTTHFFNKLDNLIALLQTKLDKFQSFKKTYLQKMFI